MAFTAEERNRFAEIMLSARIASHQSRQVDSAELYEKAVALALERSDYTSAKLARVALLELKCQFEEADEQVQSVVRKQYELKGIAYFYQASVLRERQRFTEALDACRKAIHGAGPHWKAWAYNNEGDLYELIAESQTDESIRDGYRVKAVHSYEKCLREPDDSPRYIERYNLGRIHLRMRNLVVAVNELQQSLVQQSERCRDDLHYAGLICRELGTAFFIRFAELTASGRGPARAAASSARGRNGRQRPADAPTGPDGSIWQDADRCFARADEWWAKAIDHLTAETGNEERDKRDRDKSAVVDLKRILAKECRAFGSVPGQTQRFGPDSNNFKLVTWVPAGDIQTDGYSTPEERIVTKIAATEKDVYERYISQGARGHPGNWKAGDPKDFVAILRGWGSAVPLVPGMARDCRGGGYFLRWRGCGIIVDPGIDFIRNFHRAGFHLHDANVVMVSHVHTDHSFDLEALDDLRYEMYRRARNDAEHAACRWVIILDELTERRLRRHWTNEEWPAYVEPIRLESYRDPRIHRGARRSDSVIPLENQGLPFRIRYFVADHSRDVANYAFGFRIECLETAAPDAEVACTVGFTCDTRFFPELSDAEHLGQCDLLVAHVSQPEALELLDANATKFDAHLGYRGVERLISQCQPRPRLTLIGEFWAGIADLRFDIVQGLRRRCGTEAILPSSETMVVSLPGLTVRCTKCGDWLPWERIRVASPTREFGPLGYLCHSCSL